MGETETDRDEELEWCRRKERYTWINDLYRLIDMIYHGNSTEKKVSLDKYICHFPIPHFSRNIFLANVVND